MKAAGLLVLCMLAVPCGVRAQEDGGVSYDSRGHELLESLDIPPLSNAPFSLILVTEWSRPMSNGGTYTETNRRPIKRDSAGRMYQERWLLVPKGTKIVSEMSWIQISDPVAKTLLECSARQHVCALEDWRGWNQPAAHPELVVSGELKSGRGTHLHEDLGKQFLMGLPVHQYRETTTLRPGTMGNDRPLVTLREFSFSSELGFTLRSALDTPQLGHQLFDVVEITTSEPEAKYFQVPEGYRVVDQRKAANAH